MLPSEQVEVLADVTEVPSEARRGYLRADRVAHRKDRTARLAVLVAVLAGVTGVGLAHRFGVNVVGVDALCPFGGLESLWSLALTGALLQRVAVSSLILLGGIVAIAVVFGRAFCGQICPLGTVQELFGRLGRKVFRGKRLAVPAAVDRPARYLKYVVLAVFTVWTWQAADLVMRPYDPWVAWQHLTSAEVLTEFGAGLAVLGVALAGSLAYDRFFCKYLCPVGAVLGPLSRLSLFKVRRDAGTCIDCSACDRACPMNLEVSSVDSVTSAECIACNECVNACPVQDTLDVRRPKGGAVRPVVMTAVVAGILAGVTVLGTASGAFAWTLPSLEKKPAAPGVTGGTVNVDDIRGYMTFADIAAATGIPASEFEQRFGVPAGEMGQKAKDLAARYGFDVHTDLRDWVKERMAAGAEAGTDAPPAGE